MRRALAPTVLAAWLGVFAIATPAAAQLSPIGAPNATPNKGVRGGERAGGPRPFRLGIVAAGRPDAATERVDPFRRHLATILDMPVTVAPFETEAALVGALVAGRVDYAPLSAIGFATAIRLCDCVEPLATPRDGDRAPGWFAIVIAKTGSGIGAIGDLATRRLAISRGEAIGTRRLPLMAIDRAGLSTTGADGVHLVETDGPTEALRALLDGRADAAVVWSSLDGARDDGWSRGPITDLVANEGLRAGDVQLVWSSPLLPLGPHTVKSDLDETSKRRLREMLIQLDADPDVADAIEPTHSGGFVRVGTPSYRPFVDLLTPPPPPGESDATGTTAPKG